MRLRNSRSGYGWIAIGLHWTAAIGIGAMLGLGLWMTSLDYYHAWYHRAPELHKSLGAVLALLFLARLLWRWTNPLPAPLPHWTALERQLSRWVHVALLLLPLALVLSGWLIATADGRPLRVFGLLEIPAWVTGMARQEDRAGIVHTALAWTTLLLIALHVGAALRHHFLRRDRTLLRMVRPEPEEEK
jgi:cytochrome b561